MIINKVPRDIANAEIENGEVVLSNTGKTFTALGEKHSKGGTPVFLEDQTRILSKKLKADKDVVKNLADIDKEMSYADLGKKYMTDNELKTLNDKKADKLELETAQLMLTKKLAQLDSIFNAQEVRKQEDNDMSLNSILSGLGGSESVFKDGGRKLPKYQRAGTRVYGDLGIDPNIPDYAKLKTNPIRIDRKRQEQLFTDSPFHIDNLYNKKVFNDPRVGDYQRRSIGWTPEQGYLTDPMSIGVRKDTVSHIFDNYALDNWKHINVKDSQGNYILKDGKRLVDTLPDGDFTFDTRKNSMGKVEPSYVDYDNVRYQPPKFRDIDESYEFDATPEFNQLPINPTRANSQLNPLPNVPLKPLSSLTKPKLPSLSPITNPEKPIDAGGDYLKEIYQMNALRDGLDLATLNVRPPEYNYKPQQVAYQRFLPMNTLAQERQFNLQKEQIENSNLPEQVKSAYVNDMYAKLQDGISDVQVRNYQGDLQNDNNNVSLYNNVTDQNRKERIQYDDRFNELNDALAVKQNPESQCDDDLSEH
jgi:hypothetical protein